MGLALGIDAAWSLKNPSGVALVATGPNRPRLIRAAPSYEHFVHGAPPGATLRRCGRSHLGSSALRRITRNSRHGEF